MPLGPVQFKWMPVEGESETPPPAAPGQPLGPNRDAIAAEGSGG